MSKQKIVSIEIELKDYEPIKFTMAEAKELHEQLDALFGKKEVVHKHYNDYWWNRPYYTWLSNGVAGAQVADVKQISDITGKTVASNNTAMKVSYKSA